MDDKKQRRPSREHQRRSVPWDRQKNIWFGKCEMSRFHNQQFSNEHRGETAPVCAVLEYMDPNNIPFDALTEGPTNSGKTHYLMHQMQSPFFLTTWFWYSQPSSTTKPTTGLWIATGEFLPGTTRKKRSNSSLSWAAVFPREQIHWLFWTIVLPWRT